MALLPMKATSGPLPTGDGWVYETKWDGMRVVADVSAAGVRAVSANGRDCSAAFPELAALGPALAPVEAVLDGEVVALDDRGRPSFERLQHRMHVTSPADAARRAVDTPVAYVVFDLLRLGGHDLTGQPWRDRRRLLDQIAEDFPPGVDVARVYDDGPGLLEATRAQGMEGVVAKRTDAAYVPGGRSRRWVKVKVRLHDEMVVGGWSGGAGNREGGLGSILVGYHATPGDGVLRYAGRVGSGFTFPELTRLGAVLAGLDSDTCPFVPPPPALHRKGAHWVRPEVVVEVEYGEWTAEGRLRHPVYLGQRTDKAPAAVVRPGREGAA
ncbi:MAG TPA: non-homologous end-joining DNA ligase [Acidimicrobiales bacterium]|nr:non-homologous end-joining DNA ligase [Acidimicrobiales bacterium]